MNSCLNSNKNIITITYFFIILGKVHSLINIQKTRAYMYCIYLNILFNVLEN